MENTITLRGHHIETLAERYAEKQGLFVKQKTPKKSEGQKKLDIEFEEYKNKWGVEAYNKLMDKINNSESTIYFRKLSENLNKKDQALDLVMSEWLLTPDLQVKIVYGGDSVCQSCPEKDCFGRGDGLDSIDYNQDKTPLLQYNIDEDRMYTMKELIGIFKEHIDRTGFPSPRTRNGFGSKNIEFKLD